MVIVTVTVTVTVTVIVIVIVTEIGNETGGATEIEIDEGQGPKAHTIDATEAEAGAGVKILVITRQA